MGDEPRLPSLRGLPRPIALDLFCGAGGVGTGLIQAGYKTVVGVDMSPKPTYAHLKGMIFVQGDVRKLKPEHLKGFDLVWASPPCQAFSGIIPQYMRDAHEARWKREGRHLNLIPFSRKLVVAGGTPYIIENVLGAKRHLRSPIMLCGTMDVFEKDNLRVFRRRLFESNLELVQPSASCPTQGYSLGARAPKQTIARPRTERMRSGATATLPAGYRAQTVMFPSRKESGRADNIYMPTTAKAKRQLQAMYGREYARSLVEVLRASGALVPMTPAEVAADVRRYKDELAGKHSSKRGGKPGEFIQMFPVFGDNISRGTTEEWAEAMGGLHWMSRKEISESIPPPFARYLGRQALKLTRRR
jgi:site-specific DNA-cytosine methylase